MPMSTCSVHAAGAGGSSLNPAYCDNVKETMVSIVGVWPKTTAKEG